MVDMQDVESSNIAAIGYDQKAQELHVCFVAVPAVYVYQGVPQMLFDAMLCADSKGSYLNRMIKGTYAFTKLEGEAEDLLTLTMTRPIFETLQRLLNNTPLNADDGAVHVVLTESASGVVTLETHKGSGPGAEDDEEDCPWHDGFAGVGDDKKA